MVEEEVLYERLVLFGVAFGDVDGFLGFGGGGAVQGIRCRVVGAGGELVA